MDISVIVCTYNRAYAVPSCLDSIAVAIKNVPDLEVEIVVVDNASSDNTQHVLEEWRAAHTVPMQIVYQGLRGLSNARNAGTGAARGDYFVLTDDDCHLSPDYLRQGWTYAQSDTEPTLRGGSVLLGDPERDLPLTIKTYPGRQSWQRPLPVSEEAKLLGGTLIGCNMMMPRGVMERAGPFDPHIGGGTPCPGADDTDFFYRAYLAGVKLEVVPDMTLRHFHGRRTVLEGRKLLENYALGNGALAAKYLFIYPRFSRHLYWGGRAALSYLITGKGKGMYKTGYYLSPARDFWLNLCGAFLFARAAWLPRLFSTTRGGK